MKTSSLLFHSHPTGNFGTKKTRYASGFTLVEILVAVAIVAILAGVLMAGLSGAIQSGYGALTVSHLRGLQAANIAYATDHNGQYAPVFASRDGAAMDTPWPINPDFANYLGSPSPNWSVSGYPAAAKSGFPVSPLGPGQNGLASIGYNMSDMAGWGGAYFSPISLYSFRVTEVHHPSQLIAFADSTDWNLLYQGRTAWVPSDDQNRASDCCVAYRNHGKGIAVAYDGSTFTFSPTDSADVNMWYNDLTKAPQ